jgi:hypothetical protein
MNPQRQTQEGNLQDSDHVELHAPTSSLPRKSVSESPIEGMPQGPDRVAALKKLGATFEEGNHKVAKIATPIEETPVPSFVDNDQINVSAHFNQ